MTFVVKWMQLEIIRLNEISLTPERQIPHGFPYVQNLELKLCCVCVCVFVCVCVCICVYVMKPAGEVRKRL